MNSPVSPAGPTHEGKYRADIDGLRAIAVIAVLGFHAGIAGFGGGFAGVDVFFVISGYLISGIIFRSLEKGSFSFSEFYVRRINRIFPALIVVLVATMVFGWFFMFTRELPALGLHVVGGATFVSNFILWHDTGYFAAKSKPLLHLWSLAVEEQFYLIFPAVALAAWRFRWSVRWTLIALIEMSFVANLWAVRHDQVSAAFYFPVTRFWEILSGALLFDLQWKGVRSSRFVLRVGAMLSRLAPAVGLMLLIGAFAFADEAMAWPGAWALLPVAGTVLLISAGPDTLINRHVLGSRLLVGIGLISYPLYLWHYPLLVFARIVNEAQLLLWVRLLLLAASVGLAHITYRLIEIPIRFGSRKRRSAARLIVALAVCGAIGLAMKSSLIPARLDWSESRWTHKWGADREELPTGFTSDRNHMVMSSLSVGDSTNIVALVGDSHAQQYWPRVELLAERNPAHFPKVVYVGVSSCPPIAAVNVKGTSFDGHPYACDAAYRTEIAYASRRNVKTVIFSAFWEDYFINRYVFLSGDTLKRKVEITDSLADVAFSLFEQDVRGLVLAGKRVVFILPNPAAPIYTPSKLPRRLAGFRAKDVLPPIVRRDFVLRTSPVTNRLRAIARRTGAEVIDPVEALCGPTICPTKAPGGMPMYWDDDHLRAEYVRDFISYLDHLF